MSLGTRIDDTLDGGRQWSPSRWRSLREWLSLWRAVLCLVPLGRQPLRGTPVMLIPGFLAGDWSMRRAGRFLRSLGYRTFTSGISTNIACTTVMVDRLIISLEHLAATEGPVALVGHSRGGTLARLVAARRPDLVGSVVALGSPLTHQFAASQQTLAIAESIARHNHDGSPERLGEDCLRGDCARSVASTLAEPLPTQVAMTSVYTREDGVVIWRSCLLEGSTHVRVRGTHNGLGTNVVALAATARALGAPLAS